MAFTIGMTVDLCMAHARVDDLDLDTTVPWVGRGKQISVELSRQQSKQKALNLLQWSPLKKKYIYLYFFYI